MGKSDAEPIAPGEPATDPLLIGPTGVTGTQSFPEERVTVSLSSGDGSPDEGVASAVTPVREGDVLSGKYRVESAIGGGGMGMVFAAQHLQLETRVALKVLRPDVAARGFAVARLMLEARASARIQGEHVVRVLDVGTLDAGTPYIVMEHLTGRDLRVDLRARGPLPVEDAVEYVLHACEAVAQAHAAGIIHRDLKPSNLFLTLRADGSPCVKVLDFGIAKALARQDGGEEGDDPSLTSSRAVLGSPMYMSPEQIRSSKDVDQRTDVWSLGLILFELLTAQRPFTGGSAASRLAATAADAPIPLRKLRREAPAELEDVILRCLEKDVARRTPSVASLARALAPFAPARAQASIERVEASLRGSLTPRGGDPTTAAPTRRPGARGRVTGATLVVVLAGVAVAYGVRTVRRSAAATPEAVTPVAPVTPVTPVIPITRASPVTARRVVAVLGFKNLSGQPESAWLSTALGEMLGTELSMGDRLRVVPREAVARASTELGLVDAAGIGDVTRLESRLGADVLVYGTYVVLGDGGAHQVWLDVKIEGASPAPGSARLSIAETGTEAELFALVSRVGERLRDALGVSALTAGEEESARAAAARVQRAAATATATATAALTATARAGHAQVQPIAARPVATAAPAPTADATKSLFDDRN